jgi:hypothetical protein
MDQDALRGWRGGSHLCRWICRWRSWRSTSWRVCVRRRQRLMARAAPAPPEAAPVGRGGPPRARRLRSVRSLRPAWPPLAVLPLSRRTVRFLLHCRLPGHTPSAICPPPWRCWPTSTSARSPPTAPTAHVASRSWLTLAHPGEHSRSKSRCRATTRGCLTNRARCVIVVLDEDRTEAVWAENALDPG